MVLRPTEGDEDAAGALSCFRLFFAASSTEWFHPAGAIAAALGIATGANFRQRRNAYRRIAAQGGVRDM